MTQKTIIGGNGAVGSNSYRVFKSLFDEETYEYQDAGAFDILFQRLLSIQNAKILVPVSNTIIGEVIPAMRVMETVLREGVQLKEEQVFEIKINHALICGPSGSLDTVTKIFTYPVALEQCRDNVEAMGLEHHFHADTYGAVVDVVKRNLPNESAIGPVEAAEDLGGIILNADMSDNPNNITTFKVFSLIQ